MGNRHACCTIELINPEGLPLHVVNYGDGYKWVPSLDNVLYVYIGTTKSADIIEPDCHSFSEKVNKCLNYLISRSNLSGRPPYNDNPLLEWESANIAGEECRYDVELLPEPEMKDGLFQEYEPESCVSLAVRRFLENTDFVAVLGECLSEGMSRMIAIEQGCLWGDLPAENLCDEIEDNYSNFLSEFRVVRRDDGHPLIAKTGRKRIITEIVQFTR